MGGAKDGKWHGPAKAIYVLLGESAESKVRTLWINDIGIVPRPSEVPGAEIKSVVRLDEADGNSTEWQFTSGPEFKGATGSLSVVEDPSAGGKSSLQLAGDFTAGGAYVAMTRNLKELEVKDLTTIRLRVKSENASYVGVQLVDSTGQTHQQSRVKITPDGKWHDMALKPAEIAGGEHWGGAKDGKWHGPATLVSLSIPAKVNEPAKQPVVYFGDLTAEVLQPVFVQPAAFKSDFEDGKLGKDWVATEGVEIDATNAYKGSSSARLNRMLDKASRPCSITSPSFAVTPGQWEISLASKAELTSPDSSYNAVVTLESLDASGRIIERTTLVDVFRQRGWELVKKRIELPKGVVSARFQAQLNKTWGSFWIDELSAAFLAPVRKKDDRILRVLFSTAQLGNLLFPGDSQKIDLTVEARRPLRENQNFANCEVRDYWGAEQTRPFAVTLVGPEKKGDRLVYEGSFDLGDASLEIGRYYEIHAAIPQGDDEAFRNHTSFAILPEAETKRYKPEEIPFTSRNWDNRLEEYIRLSDRLGILICGLWGNWSSISPYKAEAPGIELCQKLGMGWLTTTPCKFIEDGDRKYNEESLRQGVRNLLETYGHVRPLIINLGNEPHGTGDRVRANVEAYHAVYDEVKKLDPSIPVVATSVEPNEEYFRLGYGKWCDAYDFHIYETPGEVRRTIEAYRVLMKKYGVEHPIWSTELGLNSQGLTRQVVAADLIKKFVTFFAAGGSNGSWFGFLFPDPEGKDHGSSGNSHNVFDCRYNRYAPRLDAIAYFNAVNAIAIEKFIQEREYQNGIRAFLFRDRDGRLLQVIWKEQGRQDVSVPFPGVEAVEMIRIDGTRRKFNADRQSISLSVSEDPVLLLYQGDSKGLPDALGAPQASLSGPPQSIALNAPSAVSFSLNGAPAESVNLIVPPFWGAQKDSTQREKATVRFIVTPPPNTGAREAEFVARVSDKNNTVRGELNFRVPIAP